MVPIFFLGNRFSSRENTFLDKEVTRTSILYYPTSDSLPKFKTEVPKKKVYFSKVFDKVVEL